MQTNPRDDDDFLGFQLSMMDTMDIIISNIETHIITESRPVHLVNQKTIKNVLGNYSRFTKNDKKDEVEDCSICMEEFKINEGIRNLPCNHMFHKKCVDKWFKTSTFTCPICRKSFYEGESCMMQETNDNTLHEIISYIVHSMTNV